MSIAPPPTFAQVHLALQSIHPHIAYLSPVCAGACSRNSVCDVDGRKGIASASGTVLSAHWQDTDGGDSMSCGNCLFADRGGRESFGLGVPEERAQF
jgi:hypothetical protein